MGVNSMMQHELQSPLHHTTRRVRAPVPEQVDVAIIGCGLGGLQSAARLAQAGLKVACFDQHYVAGGCATMFERGRTGERWRFDIGLHYLGDCEPGGGIPTLLRNAGVEGIAFQAMDQDGFDTLVFPGLRFRVPRGLDAYRERLLQTFPSERKGIDHYCRFLREIGQLIGGATEKPGMKTLLQVALHGRLVARYRSATVAQLLDDCTRDPLLRAVLVGESGDYGVRPTQASALLHAGLMDHYLHGAYYPVGGGQVLADRLGERIEQLGGTIHLRHGVQKILVESGRAVGIVLEGQGGQPGAQVRARAVLSNADIKKTWLELLGREHLPVEAQRRADQWVMGGALWLSFFGVQADLHVAPGQATNFWQFDSTDVEDFYERAATPAPGFVPAGCYLTSGSQKDPHTSGHAPLGCSTVEAMTLVPASPEAWGVTAVEVESGEYRKRDAYLQAKARVEADMLRRVGELLPAAQGKVVFAESSTPITHYRFARASGGTGYGIAATPNQFMENRPSYRGPIFGLYQCGASTRAGHGVFGALRSGELAARRVATDLGKPLS